MKKPVKSQSPYCRHQKQPYRYSDQLRNWERAVRENRPANELARLSELHSRFVATGHVAS